MVEEASGFDSKTFLKSLTHKPGVYRMLNDKGEVLYVGKAKDLKKRVSSYFGSKAHLPKTQALMNNAQSVDVTITTTEQEALLLEYNLIKKHQPHYNVLLRDDKSYPYVYVSTDQDFPRFSFHRGARRGKGKYLGPYPGSGAVRQTLIHLQKLFRVRQCEDTFFANRTRPCLQYQIKRCSGPCVGLIDKDVYARDVRHATMFLQGKNDSVIDSLRVRMDAAADAQDYEIAADYRNQVAAIRGLHAKQSVAGAGRAEADAIALIHERGLYCVALLMVRGGHILG
jgi:excinuclease ABC subunit C